MAYLDLNDKETADRLRGLLRDALAEISRLKEGVEFEPDIENGKPYEPEEAAALARALSHILLIEAHAHGMGACRLCQA